MLIITFKNHNRCKRKKYNAILILEDDFLIKNNFQEEYLKVIEKIPTNWDFVYFGKKQGTKNDTFNNTDFYDIKPINEMVYIPSYTTWATHSICIKNTIFDDLIDTYTTLKLPVDLLLMNLYDKYSFYVLYDDLFITSFDSDIRECNEEVELKKWNWKMNDYFNVDTLNIDKIIIWGFEKISHTHHYIHNMYFNFFKEYFSNVNILWCSNDIQYSINYENTLFFVSPTHGHYTNLPINSNSLYIFHVDNFNDNLGLNIENFLKNPVYNNIIQSNRGILLLGREKITKLNYFDVDYEKNSICLPWFTNKKYHDIINVKNNPSYYYKRNKEKNYMCYFGSVWYLNSNIINSLIDNCIDKNIKLLISGRFHLKTKNHPLVITEKFYDSNKHLMSANEDTVDRLNAMYGIRQIIPIQGEDHFDNYISNRLFETISDGFIGISNNSIVTRLLKTIYFNKNVGKLIDYVEELLQDEDKYCSILKSQIDEMLSTFYGYTIIKKIQCFLQTILLKQNKCYSLTNYTDKTYTLFFSNTCLFDDYIVIDDIHKLMLVNNKKNNYIIRENEYDIFMLDKICSYLHYKIVIEEDYKYKSQLIQICNDNHKSYRIKHPIKVYCLISSQRTGSTLIVDYIQKTSKKVLALSEIFINYTKSYDVTNKNGILYEIPIQPFHPSTIHNYIKQFIHIAEKKKIMSVYFLNIH
jgi:hypothetical protein